MKHTFYLLCLGLILFSCKKQAGPAGTAGPQGPQGVPGKDAAADGGSISGMVRQYDANGDELATDLNTATVSVIGTTISTVTNATGQYTLANLQNSMYDLSVQRPGSNLMKIKQVNFPGKGNMIINLRSVENPTLILTNIRVVDTVQFGSKGIAIFIPVLPVYITGVAVLGKTAALLPDDAASHEYSTVLYQFGGMPNTFIDYNNETLKKGFSKGSTIYIKVFPANMMGNYVDPETEKYLYSVYGQPFPQTFTITMP